MTPSLSDESLLTEGVAHHQAGRFEAAESCYRRLLALTPGHPDALHYLGLLSFQRGEFAAAVETISEAIAARGDVPEFHVNLGNALKRAGRSDEAERAYRRALDLRSDFPAVWFNLALLLKASGRPEEALRCLETAARSPAALPQVWIEIGDSLHGIDDARALDSYVRAYPLVRRDSPLLARIGTALLKLGRAEHAVRVLDEARRVGGDEVGVLNALGTALAALGRLSEAERAFRQALALAPQDPLVVNALANTLKDSGLNDEAIGLYRRALDLSPDKLQIGTQHLFSLLYSDRLSAAEVLAEHRRCAALCLPAAEPWAGAARRPGRLRVGYLSPDLHANPVAYFLLGILCAHDPDRVDVHVYSTGPVVDEWTDRLRAAVPQWRSLHGQSDEAITASIKADGIDILVDLAGHLSPNVAILARRAAPVQINYLGYAFSTGVEAIDYRIVDWTSDPAGSEAFASERLLRLDRCYYAYSPPTDAPAVKPAPAVRRRHVTFGACCHFAKITPRTIDLWGRLLLAAPSARLAVCTRAFADPAVRARFVKGFTRRGIDAKRIAAQPYAPDQARWAFYHEIDVGLDTFPFNLATNTCEALWMGVPTLTFAGDAHPGRMGASLMRAAGLAEFIATDEDDWIARGRQLAGDPDRIGALRATLRDRLLSSELCDGTSAARALEAAYEKAAAERAATCDAPAV